MKKIALKNNLYLGIVPAENRLRMFVTDGTKELVCHKLTQKELDKFLQSETAHLFKGRLQLHKNKEVVIVSLKGQEAGVIDVSRF